MKIMIIDDEPDILTYLMTFLEDDGHETLAVGEDERVDQLALVYKPDLIILDIMMPKRSGISIYKELRTNSETQDIPVALFSGMSPEAEFMEEGFAKLTGGEDLPRPDGFIEKPVQISRLMEFIKSLENNRRRR